MEYNCKTPEMIDIHFTNLNKYNTEQLTRFLAKMLEKYGVEVLKETNPEQKFTKE